MRAVAVIGLSAFGEALVRQLASEHCRVLAADINESKVLAIREVADEAVVADVRDRRALEALRVTDFDVVVLSLGEPIDASLLAVLHLRDLKARYIIAKAVSEDHRRLLNQLGVTEAIFPEADMAQRTARTVARSGMLDSLSLGEGISVAEVAPPPAIVGRSLSELDLRGRHRITVVAIRDVLRDELLVIPDPHKTICDSDVLVVFGRNDDIDRFVKK